MRRGPFFYVINGIVQEIHAWETREECMADKFECDSCKQTYNPEEKRGTITLDAIGSDVMPSVNPKIKLDLCKTCFVKFHGQFVHINPLLAPFTG